jgi:hypothetical protein
MLMTPHQNAIIILIRVINVAYIFKLKNTIFLLRGVQSLITLLIRFWEWFVHVYYVYLFINNIT